MEILKRMTGMVLTAGFLMGSGCTKEVMNAEEAPAAFLLTLTDESIATGPKYSDPFLENTHAIPPPKFTRT